MLDEGVVRVPLDTSNKTSPRSPVEQLWLRRAKEDRLHCEVRLVTGASRSGFVLGFDTFTILFADDEEGECLLFKHALADMRLVDGRV